MGWCDEYKVHPAAKKFPMMPKKGLYDLGKDIKANGLKNPIVFWRDKDGQEWLIDGRNRFEAMERAGIELDPSCIETVTCGDPVSWVVTLNIRRRHLSKQQLARLIYEMQKAAAAQPKRGNKPRQVGEVSAGGRGKVDPVKAATVATGKEQDIGKRTIERAMAEVEGRKTSKRHRRTDAEIECAQFLAFVSNLGVHNDCEAPKLSDATLNLLKAEQITDAIDTTRNAIARLQKVLDRLRLKDGLR